ncbi:hypothetical protein ACFPRL_30495 [Pseudoclavibacter helvolus]
MEAVRPVADAVEDGAPVPGARVDGLDELTGESADDVVVPGDVDRVHDTPWRSHVRR